MTIGAVEPDQLRRKSFSGNSCLSVQTLVILKAGILACCVNGMLERRGVYGKKSWTVSRRRSSIQGGSSYPVAGDLKMYWDLRF